MAPRTTSPLARRPFRASTPSSPSATSCSWPAGSTSPSIATASPHTASITSCPACSSRVCSTASPQPRTSTTSAPPGRRMGGTSCSTCSSL
uniref:Uncharacterized protein n=1 Tax=Arundo donax TaxID=35708 RepID=A0A0A9DXL9_ARUDO